MSFFEIILFGLFVNFVVWFVSFIVLFFLFSKETLQNPYKIIEINYLQNSINELKRLKMNSPFQEKYIDLFAYIIPYASLLISYTRYKGIIKDGSFINYIENEIRRLKILTGEIDE